MPPPHPEPLNPGLAVIHANRLESLCDLIVAWTQAHPLAPLENEVVLVQSNGMAQWLKLALAETEGLGICAAVQMQLPGRFLWSAYQTVLSAEEVPDASPFDKAALAWRLFRLLPTLWRHGNSRFAPLQRFLADDGDERKRRQLAECLADLFDQYQVYRADWLQDWADGYDQLRDAHGQPRELPAEHGWQAELWRAVLQDVPLDQQRVSRAFLHERFIAALTHAPQRPAGLPRRIVVFGISSLPQQMLMALAALSRFCQVLLCVHNPCRYYWADIIEHRELLRAERRRQAHKPQMPADLPDEELHLHANPLLAAWGKQGRDYIRLLDEFDEPERYRDWFQRIDLFEDCAPLEQPSLLQQVQQAILDLTPLPQHPSQRPAIRSDDDSVVFHVAHSPQREVEILHDQLLALFAAARQADRPLLPREVIVMVPDIDTYAPHIRAVFGQIDADDARYLPFSLADQRERGQNPLLIAVESLLHLPQARFAVSDVLALLEVPALRRRFGVAAADLPTLHRWIEAAGIRWGLHAEQRADLGLGVDLEQNSWRFGLKRMLLGYAVGSGAAWDGIEPYEEIGGLDAAMLGPLVTLLDALEAAWQALRQNATPTQWGERLRHLLDTFFVPCSERDELTLERLAESLEQWEEVCAAVALEESLPLSVVREAWLAALDQPSLSQRFLAGRVNFCTLMPMRAIPFKVVCLMGMNDGDYPRSQLPLSFDLMSGPGGYRPGDRSRREDDRYLFLEALLSAREKLYVSWLGRYPQDNSERPASLLVGQLRDYLAAGWQAEADGADVGDETDPGRLLLARLTVEHPLQAFSRRYFASSRDATHDPRLFSYAHEWRAAHDGAASVHRPLEARASRPPGGQDGRDPGVRAGWPRSQETAAQTGLAPLTPQASLTLEQLGGFLRHPVKAFFNQRLKVWFEQDDSAAEDIEPFVFDGLQEYALGQELLHAALAAPPGQAQQAFAAQMERQRRQGRLPLAGFAAPAQQRYADPAWSACRIAEAVFAEWPVVQTAPLEIVLACGLEDWLPGLRQNPRGEWAQILVRPMSVKAKGGQPKWHNLVAPWVRHLAGCAQGLPLHTLQIGADGIVSLPPLAQETAQDLLQTLLGAWRQGMNRPLPLACKSAFAWLQEADPDAAGEKAQAEYEGGYHCPGEVQQDAYLARAFPDFARLTATDADGDFAAWLDRLYRPLWQAHAV